MNPTTITIDNNSSFRTVFDQIMTNCNKQEITVVNGMTFNSYDFSKRDDDIIYNTIKKIMTEIPHAKLCLTFQLETQSLKIECNPFIGSA